MSKDIAKQIPPGAKDPPRYLVLRNLCFLKILILPSLSFLDERGPVITIDCLEHFEKQEQDLEKLVQP